MMDEIINKVDQKNLLVFDLSEYFPKSKIASFDISQFLVEGLLLREKDFRGHCKAFDWSIFQDHHLCICCSTDAILPAWANLLITKYAGVYAKSVTIGSKQSFLSLYYQKLLNELDLEMYNGERVIIKGCSNVPVPEQAYVEATRLLSGIVKRLSYGEACSQVPL